MAGICEICGANPVKKASAKYCGIACRGVARRRVAEVSCAHCGLPFTVRPHRIGESARQGRNLYCSHACVVAGQTGAKKPSLVVEPQERRCATCGESFLVGGRLHKKLAQRFCSLLCMQRGRYHRGRDCAILSDTDAAYIAGFIDGEGSVLLLGRANGSVGVLVTVANTHQGVIDWLIEATGVGRRFFRARKSERHKPTYWWQANADAAEGLLRQIRPYLKIKAAQADLALETQERLRDPSLKADRSWQAEYIERSKAMNRRGPTVGMTATSGG